MNLQVYSNKKLDKTLPDEVLDFAFLLKEYRLQVFAQGAVSVKDKVSEKRLGRIF